MQFLVHTTIRRGRQCDSFPPSFSWTLSRCLARPTPLSLSSSRFRVHGKLHGVSGVMLTIDTATDVPLISHAYLQPQPILHNRSLMGASCSALELRSANASPLEILGLLSLDLLIGDLTQQIECFVPSLGPDTILLRDNILSAFRALLDWDSQTLSPKTSSSISSVNRRGLSPPHHCPANVNRLF